MEDFVEVMDEIAVMAACGRTERARLSRFRLEERGAFDVFDVVMDWVGGESCFNNDTAAG